MRHLLSVAREDSVALHSSLDDFKVLFYAIIHFMKVLARANSVPNDTVRNDVFGLLRTLLALYRLL